MALGFFVARLVLGDRAANVKRSLPLASLALGEVCILIEQGLVCEGREVFLELLGDLYRDDDDHDPVEPNAGHGYVEQLAGHVIPDRFVQRPKRALPVGTLDQGVDDLRPEVGADTVELVGSHCVAVTALRRSSFRCQTSATRFQSETWWASRVSHGGAKNARSSIDRGIIPGADWPSWR